MQAVLDESVGQVLMADSIVRSANATASAPGRASVSGRIKGNRGPVAGAALGAQRKKEYGQVPGKNTCWA